MLRMQEMAFPCKFQKFSGEYAPEAQTPLFMRGMSATHVAFSRSYPPLIYSISQKGPFSKNAPPPGKSLKKALIPSQDVLTVVNCSLWLTL
jgi:hypothetical protein